MAPADRRAALVAATVPLLRQHGLAISTRQIAQAAGVAEGTIFGVFPDKTSLILAAVRQALDPVPVLAALGGIETDAPLRARLTAATDIVSRRFVENAPLLAMARGLATAPDIIGEVREQLGQSRQRILSALAAVVEPDRAALRRGPATVAGLLLLLVAATTHGMLGEPESAADSFSGDEIVAVLLDGLLVRSPGAETNGGSLTC
jgi:AcrR family transcriptional regulator